MGKYWVNDSGYYDPTLAKVIENGRELRVQKQTITYYRTQAYQNRLKRRNALNGNVRVLVSLAGDEI